MSAGTGGALPTAVQLLGPSTGGIRVHVAALAAGLPAHGFAAPVVGPARVLAGLAAQAGEVPVPAGSSPVGLVRARRALGPWRGRARVLHAHGLKAAWTAVGGRPTRPLVATLHNVVLPGDAPGAPDLLRRRAELEVLRRVDRLVVPTTAMVDALDRRVPRDRIRVVLPASPAPEPHRSRQRVRADLGVADERPLAVCAARLHPQKDLPTLLRAWAAVVDEVPAARLALVGDGPLRAEVEAAASARELRGSVLVAGASAHAVDELAAADVAVISSVWEAVPLVLVEALQLGVPVVSTDVGLARELLGGDPGGPPGAGAVVPVGDADALGAELALRLADPTAARAAAQAGAAAARARFAPDAAVAAVADVYRELL